MMWWRPLPIRYCLNNASLMSASDIEDYRVMVFFACEWFGLNIDYMYSTWTRTSVVFAATVDHVKNFIYIVFTLSFLHFIIRLIIYSFVIRSYGSLVSQLCCLVFQLFVHTQMRFVLVCVVSYSLRQKPTMPLASIWLMAVCH